MELTTIKIFDNPIDLHLLKAILEDEGVKCFVFDENIVSVNPMYSYAVGGIKLKVRDEDFQKGQQIIDEIENAAFTDQNGEVIHCPHCHSKELIGNYRTVNDAKSILAVVTSFICNVIPFYMKSVYKCKKCDFEFTAKNELDF